MRTLIFLFFLIPGIIHADDNSGKPTTKTYTSSWTGKKYSATFDETSFSEKIKPGHVDFQVKGKATFPSYISIGLHKLNSPAQTPAKIIDVYYDPQHPKAEITSTKLGENQVYLFPAPQLSSAYTEFAVFMWPEESMVVMFQAPGPEKEALEADRQAFLNFLSLIKYNL